MENLKLISVRLDADTLKKIDHIASEHSYLNRSRVINSILQCALACSDDDTLWQMIIFNRSSAAAHSNNLILV